MAGHIAKVNLQGSDFSQKVNLQQVMSQFPAGHFVKVGLQRVNF